MVSPNGGSGYSTEGAVLVSVRQTMRTFTKWNRFSSLDLLQLPQSEFVIHVSGIQGRRRLEQHDPGFLVGDRFVLDSAWHHNKLAFFEPHRLVAKFNAEAAVHHQKHFVFIFVVMP